MILFDSQEAFRKSRDLLTLSLSLSRSLVVHTPTPFEQDIPFIQRFISFPSITFAFLRVSSVCVSKYILDGRTPSKNVSWGSDSMAAPRSTRLSSAKCATRSDPVERSWTARSITQETSFGDTFFHLLARSFSPEHCESRVIESFPRRRRARFVISFAPSSLLRESSRLGDQLPAKRSLGSEEENERQL